MRSIQTLAALLTFLFVAVLALFFTAILGYCVGRWFREHTIPDLLSFAALWVLFEWLRSWLFTGFPWLLAPGIKCGQPTILLYIIGLVIILWDTAVWMP